MKNVLGIFKLTRTRAMEDFKMDNIKKDREGIDRRNFLKGAAAGALGLTASSLLPVSADAEPLMADKMKKWDDVYDVVIIGSGFAGLAAAIEAKNAGAKVLVLDKMPLLGGNSIINGGDFAAAGTRLQKEAGVEDSPELMLKDMLKAGLYLNHMDKARIVAEQSNEALEWCMNYLGARFTRLTYHGGHSVKRTNQAYNASGSDLVNKMLAKAKELKVDIQTRTKLEQFISNKEGRIVGLEIRKGYRFPDENSGKTGTVKARRAVILASGGFARDTKLRLIHDPRLNEKFDSTNHPGATGEALLAACLVGAMDLQMDWIQLGPWASPDEKGFGHVPLFCERLVGYAPMVNPKTGKRFFKETGNRKERADAIILIGEPVVILGDSYAVPKQVFPEALEGGLKVGAVKKFDSLEDLAKNYNMPVASFLDEVARWNSFVEKRKDADFDCLIFPDAKPTAGPPFYAARLWPKVHHTMGGLVTDVDNRVFGFDMKTIKGLYAVGEVAGGIHGAVRLGGCAMADCVVNGRIAGKKAAAEKPWA
jgi:flavocytochrome c